MIPSILAPPTAGGPPPPTITWDYGIIANAAPEFGVISPTDPISDFDYIAYIWLYPSAVRANRHGYTSQFGRQTGFNINASDETTAFDRFRGGFWPSGTGTAYFRINIPEAGKVYRIFSTHGGVIARTVRCAIHDGDENGTVFYTSGDAALEADERCDLGDWSAMPIATAHARLDNNEGYIEHTFVNTSCTFAWERVSSTVIPFCNYMRLQRLD